MDTIGIEATTSAMPLCEWPVLSPIEDQNNLSYLAKKGHKFGPLFEL